MNLPAIQSALRERNIDAWLFYDHHHRDPIAYRVLGLPASLMVTRRWFYLIPAQGEPLETGAQDRGRTPGFPARRQERVLRMAGVVRSTQGLPRQPQDDCHAVFAQQPGVHGFAGGCGNDRTDPRHGKERGQRGRPDRAIRSRPGPTSRFKRTSRRAMRSTTSQPRPSRRSADASAMAAQPNMRCSNGSWKPSGARIWSPTILPWWPSMPTAAIRTTSHTPKALLPFARATSFCWMSGRRKTLPVRSTTTSPGPDMSAKHRPTSSARFSRSSATHAMLA